MAAIPAAPPPAAPLGEITARLAALEDSVVGQAATQTQLGALAAAAQERLAAAEENIAALGGDDADLVPTDENGLTPIGQQAFKDAGERLDRVVHAQAYTETRLSDFFTRLSVKTDITEVRETFIGPLQSLAIQVRIAGGLAVAALVAAGLSLFKLV